MSESLSQDDDLDLTLSRSRVKVSRRRANVQPDETYEEDGDTVDDSPTRRIKKFTLRPSRPKIKEKQRSKRKRQITQPCLGAEAAPETAAPEVLFLHATRSASDLEADLEDNRDYDSTDKHTNGLSDEESSEEEACSKLKVLLAQEIRARHDERRRLTEEIKRKDLELKQLREELKKIRLKSKD